MVARGVLGERALTGSLRSDYIKFTWRPYPRQLGHVTKRFASLGIPATVFLSNGETKAKVPAVRDAITEATEATEADSRSVATRCRSSAFR
jgi:hypothetical protein